MSIPLVSVSTAQAGLVCAACLGRGLLHELLVNTDIIRFFFTVSPVVEPFPDS